MQHPATSLVFAFCLAYSGFGEAAYVIKLGNGNEFITGRYWQEGQQLLFDIYGGVFGVDRAFVSKIEKSGQTTIREANWQTDATSTLTTKNAQIRTSSDATRDLKSDNNKPVAVQETKTPSLSKEVRVKDERVLEDFSLLQKRFAQLNDLPLSDVDALQSDIDSFKSKLEQSDLAAAHQDEINAAGTLLRAIDGYLKVANR
jgi:hypothetical protein